VAYCAAFSALFSAVAAIRFSSSLVWLRTHTMPTTIRKGARGTKKEKSIVRVLF
jgi:hypothetical protein